MEAVGLQDDRIEFGVTFEELAGGFVKVGAVELGDAYGFLI